jgi:hypothetical protein
MWETQFSHWLFILWHVHPLLGNDPINKPAINKKTKNRVDPFLSNARNTRKGQSNRCRKRCFLCDSHISTARQRMCFLCCGPTRGKITRWQQCTEPPPCVGGGVEYLHHGPVSCRRRRIGMSQIWDCKYGPESQGTRTRKRLLWQGSATYTKDRPRAVLTSERVPHRNKTVTVKQK